MRGRKKKGHKKILISLPEEAIHTLNRNLEEFKRFGIKDRSQLILLMIALVQDSLQELTHTLSTLQGENRISENQFQIHEKEFWISETKKRISKISNLAEVIDSQALKEIAQTLERVALQGGGSFERPTPVAGATHPGRFNDPFGDYIGDFDGEYKNTIRDPSTYVEGSLPPQDPFGSFGGNKPDNEQRAKEQTLPSISMNKAGKKNISNTADATEYHFQSQQDGGKEGAGISENTSGKIVVSQRLKDTKNTNEGKGLYDFATPCGTNTFSERMEEHRKRLSKLLQEEGLKWKVERLMVVVKEWEREWGEWKEEWDRYLIDLLGYPIHEKRIAGRIRKVDFPGDVEPNFPYIAVPALRDIKKAEAEGKEVVETFFGDIKLRRKRKKRGELTAKDILRLWNEKAKEEKLIRKTELTPSLKSEIETYLELHPEKEWWERVFSLVPYAVRKTRSPSEPRAMDWLFVRRKKGEGKIIDWVLTLEGEAKKSERETKLMMGRRLEKLLTTLEENGISREEFKELLRSRKVKVEKKEDGRVFFFSWRKGDREFERFFSLVSADKLGEAVEYLKKELVEVVR